MTAAKKQERRAGKQVVLDASALIAYLLREPGIEVVIHHLNSGRCQVSSVTLTELEGKLVGRGDFTHGQLQTAIQTLLSVTQELPFGAQCREKAAFYYARKSPYDLSLGDAACLGTAQVQGKDVLTAERGWAKIPDLPFKVNLIR
jgi:ribonuclease VapC